jgi:hypothetical protein
MIEMGRAMKAKVDEIWVRLVLQSVHFCLFSGRNWLDSGEKCTEIGGGFSPVNGVSH